MPPDDIRLRQLGRMLGRTGPGQVAIGADDAPTLAGAIFDEASNSDDVTGETAATTYLDDRLEFFAGLLTQDVAASVRAHFIERWRAWERV